MIKFVDDESEDDDSLCAMSSKEVVHLPRVGDTVHISEVIDGTVVSVGHMFSPYQIITIYVKRFEQPRENYMLYNERNKI